MNQHVNQKNIWVDKGSELYNRSMKLWVKKLTQKFIQRIMKENLLMLKIQKNKFYKCMTSISKNVYIHKLEDIVNKYKNTYHSTIKMTTVDVKIRHIH